MMGIAELLKMERKAMFKTEAEKKKSKAKLREDNIESNLNGQVF